MKLTENIHLLRIDFEISISPEKKMQRFVNVLIIFGSKITLVDTGVKGSEPLIFNYIESQGRAVADIDRVILSHSHPDHIGSAAAIKGLTHCKVLSHSLEREWIENIEMQNQQRPVPGFFNLVDSPVSIDQFIEDGQLLGLGEGLTLCAIHSPGHSKGSLNLLFVEDRVLFTADSVPLKNDIPNYDNYFDLMRSLEKIKSSREYDVLLTSWTPAIRSKAEIEQVISEGEEYMKHIDTVVKKHYTKHYNNTLENCRLAVAELGLPPFLANPIVDKAFRGHWE